MIKRVEHCDTLFIVDLYDEKVQRFAEQNRNAAFLTSDSKTYLTLNSQGYEVFIPQDFFSSQDVAELDPEAINLLRNKCFINEQGKDITFYKNICFGSYVEEILLPGFFRAIRDIASIHKALTRLRPENIVVWGAGPYAQAAALVVETAGFKYRRGGPGGALARLIYFIKWFIEETKHKWLSASPFKALFLEPILDVLILKDALLKKLTKAFGGKPLREQASNTLIVSADIWCKPFYRHFLEKGGWNFFVTGKDYRMRKREFKDVIPLEINLTFSSVVQTSVTLVHFMLLWWKLKSNNLFIEKFSFLGVNFWDLVKNSIKYSMLITFPRIHMDYLIVGTSLKTVDARKAVVALPFDQTPNYRALIQACREAGARTIVLQHGHLSETNGYDTIHTDYYAAWGERSLEWFGRFGNDPHKMYIIGNPRFDNKYIELNKPRKLVSKSDIGLPTEKNLIVVMISTGNGTGTVSDTQNEGLMTIYSVIEALRLAGLEHKCHVVLKFHPRSKNALYIEYARELQKGFPGISMFFDKLDELLLLTDICVSNYSTSVLEAMLIEKPSIIFDHYFKRELTPYVSMGAALGASNANEMAEAIKMLLFDKNRLSQIIDKQKEFITYCIYKFDGKATQRACSLIEDIANSSLKEWPLGYLKP